MNTRSFRLFLAGAALAILAILPACAFPGGPTPPPTGGTGAFNGVFPWGTGASGCSRVEGPTVLRFECNGIGRNFIGSWVLIRFPTKNFNAHVELAANSNDPRQGLNWYEQDTTVLTPEVFRFGSIHGTESVDVNGSNVPRSNEWDLGLDRVFGTTIGLPATVNAVITITLIQS